MLNRRVDDCTAATGRGDGPPWGGQDGSTLLMYPFAVLIVIALGSIAVDATILFQSHRQAVDVAAGVASDIAGVLDEAAFAAEGVVEIDRARAADVLAFTNGVALADHPNDLACTATITDAPAAVEVVCTGTGRALLLPVTGASGDIRLRGTAVAVPDERG